MYTFIFYNKFDYYNYYLVYGKKIMKNNKLLTHFLLLSTIHWKLLFISNYLFLEINANNNRLINQSNKKQTKREREERQK